jgi:excisionase family DNA binding protein
MPEKVPRDDGHAVTAVPVESQRMVAEAVRNEIQPMLERLDALVAATDEVLTMNGVQKLLGACSKTVLAWIRDHGLPARKIGAEWRFRKSYVVQWIGGRDVR